MIETTKYHTLAAFLLGVTVASVWSAYKIRQNALQGGNSELPSAEYKVEQDQEQSLHSSQVDRGLARKDSVPLELAVVKSVVNMKEGIEGCIGNTPLIKIKSLSDATGCEILAKAEVIDGFINDECPISNRPYL
jgi:cysteine synthase A